MLKIIIIAFLAVLPCFAYANAGLPMIFIVMPPMALSIIPIIAIEATYIAKKLHISNGQSASVTILSNIFSTIVGVPIVWLLMAIVSGGRGFGMSTLTGKILSVTLGAAWLTTPVQSDLNWMVPLAWLFLLIPFYFISWWSESYIIRKLLMFKTKEEVSAACRNANLITYVLLALWPIGSYLTNSYVGS